MNFNDVKSSALTFPLITHLRNESKGKNGTKFKSKSLSIQLMQSNKNFERDAQ